MSKFKRHLITAALPYANGPLHIGHLAGCYLSADAYARYLRSRKCEVLFICGSDEYGVPISIRALRENCSPQDIVDKYHNSIQQSFAEMGISFDIYTRTTDNLHHQTVQEFFLQIHSRSGFKKIASEQFFDPEQNMFLADRYIQGACRHCGFTKAYGDQCEKCGSTLSPEELLNPKSTISGQVLIKRKTWHWYLPLEDYQEEIANWILKQNNQNWKPNVLGQCRSWLDQGLRARAITRDAQWGIPVPLAEAEGKVLYVWFDAPIGYITATKKLCNNWQDYWMREDSQIVHFVGKDNIVFHCIVFPAMLKASGQNFIMPDNVPANEFLNIEGQKISTSRNWAIWVDDYLRDFPNMQDALRYTLFSILPETKDADFTWKDFQIRTNSELVGILGNFIHRTFILAHKLCQGRIPVAHTECCGEQENKIIQILKEAVSEIERNLEHFKFREALQRVMDVARMANKYLQQKAPWIFAQQLQAKPELQRDIDTTINYCLQISANLAIFLQFFLPFTAQKICYLLKVVPKILDWNNAGKINLLLPKHSIRPPELLFTKIEDHIIQEQMDKLTQITTLNSTKENSSPIEESKELIAFADFQKLDLCIGLIKEVAKVPKTDKLYQLLVDLGTEKRTIVSGIAEHFSAEELLNKRVLVLANLEPRKIRGIESKGMLLMASSKDNKLHLITTISETEPGSPVS